MKFYKLLKNISLLFFILKDERIRVPVLVNQDGVIIDGHTRNRIAKVFGYKIPVIRIQGDIEYVEPESLKELY